MKLVKENETAALLQLELSGHVNVKHLSPERDPLSDLLGADDFGRVVLLNLQMVETLDSSGVSWLLSSHRRFRAAGGRLLLHSLSPLAENVLRVLNMQTVLEIAACRADAIRRATGESADAGEAGERSAPRSDG